MRSLSSVLLLLLAFFSAACRGGAAGDPPCPPGTSVARAANDAWCASADGIANGPVWGRYPDGQMRYRGSASNGEMEGRYRLWHPNGQQAYEAEFHRGRVTGRFRMWDPEGHLVFSGSRDAEGEMDGSWTRWWPNGQPRLRWTMSHGHHQGKIEGWYENGARRFTGERADGRRQGVWTYWNRDGSVARVCRFESGRLVESQGDCAELVAREGAKSETAPPSPSARASALSPPLPRRSRFSIDAGPGPE